MDRIYEVKVQYAYDHNVYFVKAGDVGTAASLALQADLASPAGQALKNEKSDKPRVTSVAQFCAVEQIIT